MSVLDSAVPARTALARLPFYYGWVNMVVAAAAMTATLPGRTHGVGLVTEPLRSELRIGFLEFGALNFWAILLGAAFCWPVGKVIDRFGSRWALVGVAAGLGVVVILTGHVESVLALFVLMVLTRGLGQGALSVVSMALVGKWFRRRLGLAMGFFSVLLAIGFIVGVVGLGSAVERDGWRAAWSAMGWIILLGLVPLGWLLARSTPEACGLPVESEAASATGAGRRDFTLREALRTPAFWAFTAATSFFNLTWSALTLFNQSILNEQGFDRTLDVGGSQVTVFVLVMGLLTASGLVSNLLGGWAAARWPPGRLLGVGMLILAGSLIVFPWLQTVRDVTLYALTLGLASGLIVVVHFAAYPELFGRAHLGQIQGVGQVVSVFASALGPVLIAAGREWTGSYDLLFFVAAPTAALLGVVAWCVPLPRASAPERTL
jgi:MFS family permease